MTNPRRQKKREKIQEKLKDYTGLINEMVNDSDRCAAIVGAAFVEEHLRELIEAFLIDDKNETWELLDHTRGALGSLNAKIRAAYSMGLLSKTEYNDLGYIKDIRNKFAHDVHGITFNDDQIRDWCNNLLIFKDHDLTLKAKLVNTVFYLSTIIQHHKMQIIKNRCIVKQEY